ncbi:MAG: winged helix-turn-helix transcriptional regulator [Candidatus Sigynarchaeota archaeon]
MVLCAAFWPVLFALKPPEVKVQSQGMAGITISGSTMVPIVIAASFTRITDRDNNLVMRTEIDGNASTRESIFALIASNPGIHFRDICRRLNKEIGVIQYHLRVLERFNLVTSERDGRFTRFFVKSAHFDGIAKNILASWQRPVERRILSSLAMDSDNPGIMKSVMADCGVTSQAITWHMNRLKVNGLIQSTDGSLPVLVPAVREKMLALARQGLIQLTD